LINFGSIQFSWIPADLSLKQLDLYNYMDADYAILRSISRC